MAEKPKYSKGETVKFAGKLYEVESYKKAGTFGIEYNLIATLPDKKTEIYEKCFLIPEGFINKA